MTVVTFALPAESAALARRLISTQQRGVEIFHTGVGAEVCRERFREYLQSHRPDLVIGSGFAGGLRDDLNVGDLFLADNFSNPAHLQSARSLLADRPLHVAPLFTSPRMIATAEERANTAATTGAAAVDMETSVIAEECAVRGIPFLSLRIVSDTAALPLPAPPEILFDMEQQRTDYARLAFYLVRRPASLPHFIRFARLATTCQKRLAEALLAFLQKTQLAA